MPRNVLCCLVLWFPFLVFTPSEVVCCANCTPSNPISLLLRADNTVHNVETILLRGVDIYCSTIEYKIPLCKVSLPYIPYTPHPNSIAERSTKFEESHFWPFLSFLLEIRTIGLMFCWERNGFVCLQFLFSCFFITLIVAHADGKRPLQGDWSVLLTRKSTCCAIFYLFLDKIDFWCSNIYLHLFGEQCSCAMYLFWWFLSGFKYLTTRKTFAVLLSLLNSLRIKNGYTCYMGGRIEEKNNSGYTCYTGKRIEEKTMATLVTWEGESEKNNGRTWRIGVPLLTRKSTCCAERPPDTLLLTLTETWWRLWCLSGRSTMMGKHWFCMALGGVSNRFQIASPSSVITNVMMGFAVLKM